MVSSLYLGENSFADGSEWAGYVKALSSEQTGIRGKLFLLAENAKLSTNHWSGEAIKLTPGMVLCDILALGE